MRIAIIGASGRSGKAAVAHALGAGHEVIAVVRKAASAPAGTTVRVADARDVAALTVALQGADAVISSLGRVAPPAADDPILADGARALVSAMDAAGVSRL